MNKLVAIRIKYDDETYSDEIPIGALVENVQWDNLHSLVDILGNVDVDTSGSIQTQIDQLFNDKVSTNDLSTYVNSTMKTEVSSWLNTYISPATGTIAYDASLSVEGAAADAKAAGQIVKISTTKPTQENNRIWVGTAEEEYQVPTMEEFNQLKEDLNETINSLSWSVSVSVDIKDDYNWEIAGCNNYGANVVSTTRIVNNVANSVNYTNEDIYVKSSNPSVIFFVYERTNSTGVMTGSGWLTEYTIKSGTYFKIIVRSDPESTITSIESSIEYNSISINVYRERHIFAKEYYPIKIVAKDGTGEFDTIQSAVNASKDGDVIYIKSGWYEENVINTKQVTIIGQDKYSTVLYNTTGEYATPPLWTCSGRIENITVYAWNKNNISFDSITKLGYAFHLDQKWDAVHERRHIEIRNCIFKSDFNDCIGCGIDTDAYIEISDCICEATHRSGMKVHPYPTTGTSKMLLRNNIFKNGVDENGYGLMFHTGGTDGIMFNTVEIEAYNNIAKTYSGFNANAFIMNTFNYGNTLLTMNKFAQ